MEINDFGPRLIHWYNQNKRDLPWRESQDPYSVWLSEIILQQTRVDQGLPYFLKFKEAFPTVQDLADASEEQVLNHWQGLGYYSRARNLHAAAQSVAHTMAGKFPSSAEGLQKLPGIGPYTSAAIASICFNEEIPVVDGNVYRVITRIFGVHEAIDTPAGQKRVRSIVEQRIKGNQPADFNQGMMEFGALHCTPVNPNCNACVFQDQCWAFEHQEIESLPFKARKTKVKEVYFHYLAITHNGNWLFRKRTGKGIWNNMYDFPCIEKQHELQVEELFEQKEAQFLRSTSFEISGSRFQTTHLLSHRRIQAIFTSIELTSLPEDLPANCTWKAPEEFESIPMPRLIDKFLANVDKMEP